jgi:hypothetical protein
VTGLCDAEGKSNPTQSTFPAMRTGATSTGDARAGDAMSSRREELPDSAHPAPKSQYGWFKRSSAALADSLVSGTHRLVPIRRNNVPANTLRPRAALLHTGPREPSCCCSRVAEVAARTVVSDLERGPVLENKPLHNAIIMDGENGTPVHKHTRSLVG